MALLPVALSSAGKFVLAGLGVAAGVREALNIRRELARGELAGVVLPPALAGAGVSIKSIFKKDPAKKLAKRAEKDRRKVKDDAKATREAAKRTEASARREVATLERSGDRDGARQRAMEVEQMRKLRELSASLEKLSDELAAQGQTAAATQALVQSQATAQAAQSGILWPGQLPEGAPAASILDALAREGVSSVDAFARELGPDLDPDVWGELLSGEDALARVREAAELSGCDCGGLDEDCAGLAGRQAPSRQPYRTLDRAAANDDGEGFFGGGEGLYGLEGDDGYGLDGPEDGYGLEGDDGYGLEGGDEWIALAREGGCSSGACGVG